MIVDVTAAIAVTAARALCSCGLALAMLVRESCCWGKMSHGCEAYHPLAGGKARGCLHATVLLPLRPGALGNG